MSEESYSDTAEELVRRIMALIPGHPEILEMRDPERLYDVEGFQCEDLEPSMFQACWALAVAKKRYAQGGVK